VEHEIINPLAYDIVGVMPDEGLKILKLRALEGAAATNRRIDYIHDSTIANDQFSAALAALVLAVDMNGLVFVGLEQHDDSQILVEFWHKLRLSLNPCHSPTRYANTQCSISLEFRVSKPLCVRETWHPKMQRVPPSTVV